jgi:hypothetical protein
MGILQRNENLLPGIRPSFPMAAIEDETQLFIESKKVTGIRATHEPRGKAAGGCRHEATSWLARDGWPLSAQGGIRCTKAQLPFCHITGLLSGRIRCDEHRPAALFFRQCFLRLTSLFAPIPPPRRDPRRTHLHRMADKQRAHNTAWPMALAWRHTRRSNRMWRNN